VSDPAAVAVDIVVDNYNYGRFLGAAIDSALAQTHGAVNVIVVDDGSSDNSREVISHYEGRITTILKENGGQASAVNAGVEVCEGDVVMLLDADDTLRPDAAATVAAAFAADPELVKIQFRLEVIDREGRPTGVIKPESRLAMPSGDVRSEELAQPYDLVWMATSGNAFRTAELRRIMPIPEEPFRSCADWYLVHLSALLGPVASLLEIHGAYRIHGENSYEPQEAELDLDHIRQTIDFATATSSQLLGLAGRLGLPHPSRILSIADLANRMISLRLAPARHPLGDDTRLSLLGGAIGALRRRRGPSPAVKGLFLAWFAAMAVLPRRLVRPLANAFLFPQRRRALSRLLGS
jgi:hypothetical protein